MKKLILLFLFTSICITAQPGKEAWHWQFGGGCAIDFSSGVAVSGYSPIHVYESSATLSDKNTGQLLISTGGAFAFNGNGTFIQNATSIGNQSTTQGALIIPKPGNPNIFYIISTDINGGSLGARYSVIDLTLHNGLGAVVLLHQPLTPAPVTEKAVGVKHCNGVDYWIINHTLNSNAYNAYLVTSAGINPIPVISNVGALIPLNNISQLYFPGTGYLKASPNGKKLAASCNSDSLPILELFDFDNSTGIISNPITISYPSINGSYGISFSADNKKLYAAPHKDSINWLYQYDVSSNVASTIIASQTLIAKTKRFVPDSIYDVYSGNLAAMQLAPDGKIYIARPNDDTLAVINNPNNAGLSCNFNYSGFALLHPSYNGWGLPNFIDANYAGINLNIPDVKQCASFPTDTLNAGTGFVSYQWNNGITTNSIVINAPGKYWVTVTNQQGCVKTDTVNAYVIDPLVKDTSACASCIINTTQNIVLNYNWFDGTINPIKTFTNTGTYWIDISYVGGCSIRDTFNITVNPLPIVNLGNDTTFCMGNLPLNAFNAASTYNWSTGQISEGITVTKPATYWVKVTNQYNCVTYDTLTVNPEISLFNFIMPNIVTPNNDNINDEIDFSKYQFSSLQLEIYNRWGLKVFESTNSNCIWKPNANDIDGTYFTNLQYRIDCGENSQTKSIKGFITLVK